MGKNEDFLNGVARGTVEGGDIEEGVLIDDDYSGENALNPIQMKKIEQFMKAQNMVTSGILKIPGSFEEVIAKNKSLKETVDKLKSESAEMNVLDPNFKKVEYTFWMLYQVVNIGESNLNQLKKEILEKEKFMPGVKPEIDEVLFEKVALEVAELIL